MAKLGGYAGNILQIDLTSKSAVSHPLPPKLIADFLGGAGINSKLVWDLVKPGIDPLSPENAIVIGIGPYVGTAIPGTGKCNIAGKSPASGFYGSSGSGHLGMLKFTGHDHLIITGKADHPIYLKIFNDTVEFRDARHLWGKDVWEATDAIWREVGSDYVVACIGPAAENLVSSAAIVTNKYSTFARTGMGTVMGSKNLKGIALYGTRGITVADKDRFTRVLDNFYRQFIAHPNLKEWRRDGTLISLKPFAELDLYPYKNFQEVAPADKVLKAFNMNTFLEKIKAGDVACMACPIGCKHFLRVKEGKYAGLTLSVSCVNSVIQGVGTFVGIEDWQELLRSAELCARLGLDFFNTGALISWAIELYKRGLLSKKDTGGLELEWGAAVAIQTLIQQIARREGLGDILADGFEKAARRLGGKAADYAVQIKGLGFVIDPRARLSTETYSQFTNVKGQVSNVSITMLKRTPEQLKKFAQKIRVPEKAYDKVLSGPEGFNAARLTKYAEDYTAAMESLGVCQFPLYQRFDISVWAELYSALTGIEAKPDDLLNAVDRAWDVRKAFNIREGASRKDDRPPPRLMYETLRIGNRVHQPIEPEQADRMLTEYYEERGWDPVEGSVKPERLKELGLQV